MVISVRGTAQLFNVFSGGYLNLVINYGGTANRSYRRYFLFKIPSLKRLNFTISNAQTFR